MARLRRIGVVTTNKALSSLEHGAGLDVCKLPEIARALDCSLTYLVGLTDDPASWEPDFEHWPGHRSTRPARPGSAVADPVPQPTRRPPDPGSARLTAIRRAGPPRRCAADRQTIALAGHIRRISR